LRTPPDPRPASVGPWILGGAWAIGSAIVICGWARAWRRGHGPGVYGIWRQRLILPDVITQRLSSEELAAIIAHEQCHMRYRDNLTAAIHMVVEAAFWFHPLIWWIEARLIEERERACDEEVLGTGSEPDVYASGILKVCEHYVASPIACAAGVTGADLKQRIETIVRWRGVQSMSAARWVLLTLAGAFAIAVPLLIGADRLAFEVASVKRFQPGSGGETERKITPSPDGLIARRQNLRDLIEWAYGGGNTTDIAGSPTLFDQDYDIQAKAGRQVTIAELRQMLQTLLADRFHLPLHRETKTQSVYGLIVGPRGPKLKAVDQPSTRRMYMRYDAGVAGFDMVANMERLAEVVRMFTDRKVVDETGLHGVYEIALRVPMDANPFEHLTPYRPFDGFGQTAGIFGAVEQFGLKLESKKAPVAHIVVDHAERPVEN